jgi:extracellular factor (EF) 3-hydroxypalmitic acid methyl ester biosynthesis protein
MATLQNTGANGSGESLVVCQNSHGVEIHATLVKLSRFQVSFEVYSPAGTLRLSEVLSGFKIYIQGRPVYAGRAVVSNLLHVGAVSICEATLDEACMDLGTMSPLNGADALHKGFGQFIQDWGKSYKVHPDFKVIVADMQSFLTDLRLWLERVEWEIRSAPSGNRLELEQEAVRHIGEDMVQAFDAMHERLEELSGQIEPDLRPVHQSFSKRQLHPLVLCSPFAYRTFYKPLGYAGDYEMVNMITRDPHEGASAFAKVVNRWFLSQWPAKAHRNRIIYLKSCLSQEALRMERLGQPLRILNLGCGPAREIQEFLADSLSDRARFTLLDFNDETIQHTGRVLEELKTRHGRQTEIHFQRKSVQQILKEGSRPVVDATAKKYDLVYCAGLFDYLSDRTCKQVMNILYGQVAPGGLLVGTNVDDSKPFRHMLEFVLDWHLIYRNEAKAALLLPDRTAPENARTVRDSTSVNIFIEVRKPDHD